MDVAMDTIGAAAFLIAIAVHFWRRKPLIVHSQVVPSEGGAPWWRRLQIGCHTVLPPMVLARALPILSGLAVGFRGLFWEHYVPVFGAIFDGTPREMETSLMVQLLYFLWGVSCVDAQLSYLIIACLCNCLWPVVQFYAVWGWVWSAVVILYTMLLHSWVLVHV
eukprot:TRINITY_DN16444_c0_g1_i1.p3 TRINITY_DN16444_c0_g1~~TRINITY_DN16444_c0_g1_i1.p3  ORF type:complete len:164 (-),score=64.33 TRINITY_DN16444_c0_g1_i1:71-562(-)